MTTNDKVLVPREVLDALKWYAEQAAGCRKLGRTGDAFRHALDHDGGNRATIALAASTHLAEGGLPKFPGHEFEKWFADVEAGDGSIPVPQSIADGPAWHEHIARRQIALAAWVESQRAMLAAAPQPAEGECEFGGPHDFRSDGPCDRCGHVAKQRSAQPSDGVPNVYELAAAVERAIGWRDVERDGELSELLEMAMSILNARDFSLDAYTETAQKRSAAVVVDEATLESCIENSDGHWVEDEFRITGSDLMAMLRSLASAPNREEG